MSRPGSSPLVSIVTPSLGQGRFIRAAIDSVLAQTYPHIEYIVVDGGSGDETIDILESYGDRFLWTSERDDGQSDGIRKGFERSSGEILAWLNADDVYSPDAVARAVAELQRNRDVGLVYGRGSIIDESGETVGPFVGYEPFNLWRLIHVLDYILQPSTFFRRSAYFEVGGLDSTLHWTMDWDLWIRLAAITEVSSLDSVLASSREYSATKTAIGGWTRIREIGQVAKRRAGRFWTPGVQLYALDTLRRKVARGAPGLRRAMDSAVAFVSRRITASVAVHADGWLGPRASLVVPSRWPSLELELEALRVPREGSFAIELALPQRSLGFIDIDQVGRSRHRFSIPTDAADGPFREITLSSSFDFRSERDLRKLTIRCLGSKVGCQREI